MLRVLGSAGRDSRLAELSVHAQNGSGRTVSSPDWGDFRAQYRAPAYLASEQAAGAIDTGAEWLGHERAADRLQESARDRYAWGGYWALTEATHASARRRSTLKSRLFGSSRAIRDRFRVPNTQATHIWQLDGRSVARDAGAEYLAPTLPRRPGRAGLRARAGDRRPVARPRCPAHTTNRPPARPVSWGSLAGWPSQTTASGLLGRLQQRSAAAGADQRLGRLSLDVDDERLEVRLHAAVGSNAVHPR